MPNTVNLANYLELVKSSISEKDLLLTVYQSSITPNCILDTILCPWRSVDFTPYQRHFSLQQMDAITENHNRSKGRELTVGCGAPADISATQPLHLRFRGYRGGGRAERGPEDWGISCEMALQK